MKNRAKSVVNHSVVRIVPSLSTSPEPDAENVEGSVWMVRGTQIGMRDKVVNHSVVKIVPSLSTNPEPDAENAEGSVWMVGGTEIGMTETRVLYEPYPRYPLW